MPLAMDHTRAGGAPTEVVALLAEPVAPMTEGNQIANNALSRECVVNDVASEGADPHPPVNCSIRLAER